VTEKTESRWKEHTCKAKVSREKNHCQCQGSVELGTWASSHSHAAAASLSGPPPRTAILSPFAAPVLPVPLRCPPLLDSIVPVVLALTPRLQFLGRTTVYTSAHAPSRPAAVSASKRRHEHMRSVPSSHSTAQVQQVQAKANKNKRHDGPNYRKWGLCWVCTNCMVGRNFRHRCYQL
jgi:hypothetical protein